VACQTDAVRPIVPRSIAIAVVAMACVLGLIYVLFVAPVRITNQAYALGRGVGTGVLVWALLAALLLRRSGLLVNVAALVVLCGTLGLGSLVAASREVRRVDATISAMQGELRRYADEIALVDATGEPADSQRELPAPSSDPLSELHGYSASAFDRAIRMRRDYLAALTAIGLDDLMSAPRLKADAGLAESKRVLTKAREVIDQFEQRAGQLAVETRASIDTLNISEQRRRVLRDEFDRRRAQSARTTAEVWYLERQAIDELGRMIELLDSSQWRDEEGVIAFDDKDDLAAFNRSLARIEQIAARVQTLQQEAIAKSSDALEQSRPSAGAVK